MALNIYKSDKNMGSSHSTQIPCHAQPFSNDLYLPMSKSGDSIGSLVVGLTNECQHLRIFNGLQRSFHGIWSMQASNSLGPTPRVGHFTVHDKETNTMYIGYGLGDDGKTCNDIWAFDINTYVWRAIPLRGDRISPRVGAAAVLSGNYLFVFGGYSDPQYYSELHSINVLNGDTKKLESHGDLPPPRSAPIVSMYGNNLYVWGGFDRSVQSDLFVLDMTTMVWKKYVQDCQGRTAAPYCVIGDKVYSFGGSKQGGVLRIDMVKNLVEVIPTRGTEPLPSVMSAGMVNVENLLFFFGGRTNDQWTKIYACDLSRMWWFVFNVMPDGETVSFSDGSIRENGYFLLPKLHSFSLIYDSARRSLVATLGEPYNNPSQLFVVQIGSAMGELHMRSDMLDVLQYHNSDIQI